MLLREKADLGQSGHELDLCDPKPLYTKMPGKDRARDVPKHLLPDMMDFKSRPQLSKMPRKKSPHFGPRFHQRARQRQGLETDQGLNCKLFYSCGLYYC